MQAFMVFMPDTYATTGIIPINNFSCEIWLHTLSRLTVVSRTQEATIFYKRLACLLAIKWKDEYCRVMGWLHCCSSFSLLRSAIACIRGARSSVGHIYRAPPSLDVVCVESHLNINQ